MTMPMHRTTVGLVTAKSHVHQKDGAHLVEWAAVATALPLKLSSQTTAKKKLLFNIDWHLTSVGLRQVPMIRTEH